MVEDFELHGGVDDVVAVNEWRARLHLVEEVGMVAHLLELHEDIQKLNPILAAHAVDCFDIACDDSLVELLLKCGQANEHVYLFLLGQVFLNISFESSQHERLEKPVDLRDDLFLRFGVVLLLTVENEEVVEVI